MNGAKINRVISESAVIPPLGSVKKVGNQVTYTIQMTFTTEKIGDMQNAKAFMIKHHDKMERILSRYCDLIGQLSKGEGSLDLPGAGGGIVKKLLERLGYLDES